MLFPQEYNQNPIKLYDLQLVHQMCRNNEESVLKMVEVFVGEVSKTMEEVNAAFLKNNFLEIKKLVHKIKPTLTYFGTSNLEKELHLIEKLLAKDFDSKELELKIINLTNLTKDVVDKMKTDFNITDK